MQNEEHIYISGGHLDQNGFPCDYFMRYCLESGRWERLPNMLVARRNHRAALLGDQIVVVGGKGVNRGIELSCEKYSLSTKTWSRIAAFPAEMTRLISVCTHQGNVIVVSESYPRYEVYKYCPQTDVWTLLEQLSAKLKEFDRVDSAVSYKNELWLYCYKKEDQYDQRVNSERKFGCFLRYDFRNKSLVESDSFGVEVGNYLKKNIVNNHIRFPSKYKVTTSFHSNEDLLFGHIFGEHMGLSAVEYEYRNFHWSVCHSASTGLNSVLPMKEAKDLLTCAVKRDKMYAFFNCIKGNALFRIYDPQKGVWSSKEVQKIISVADYAVC